MRLPNKNGQVSRVKSNKHDAATPPSSAASDGAPIKPITANPPSINKTSVFSELKETQPQSNAPKHQKWSSAKGGNKNNVRMHVDDQLIVGKNEEDKGELESDNGNIANDEADAEESAAAASVDDPTIPKKKIASLVEQRAAMFNNLEQKHFLSEQEDVKMKQPEAVDAVVAAVEVTQIKKALSLVEHRAAMFNNPDGMKNQLEGTVKQMSTKKGRRSFERTQEKNAANDDQDEEDAVVPFENSTLANTNDDTKENLISGSSSIPPSLPTPTIESTKNVDDDDHKVNNDAQDSPSHLDFASKKNAIFNFSKHQNTKKINPTMMFGAKSHFPSKMEKRTDLRSNYSPESSPSNNYDAAKKTKETSHSSTPQGSIELSISMPDKEKGSELPVSSPNLHATSEIDYEGHLLKPSQMFFEKKKRGVSHEADNNLTSPAEHRHRSPRPSADSDYSTTSRDRDSLDHILFPTSTKVEKRFEKESPSRGFSSFDLQWKGNTTTEEKERSAAFNGNLFGAEDFELDQNAFQSELDMIKGASQDEDINDDDDEDFNAKMEYFIDHLPNDLLHIFTEITGKHHDNICELERKNESKAVEVELLKVELIDQHEQIQVLMDKISNLENMGDKENDPGQELVDLRMKLQASEAAVAHLEWQKGQKGNKKLKKGVKKLNKTLKSVRGFGHAQLCQA